MASKVETAVSIIWVVFLAATLLLYYYIFSREYIPTSIIKALNYVSTDEEAPDNKENPMAEGETSDAKRARELSMDSYMGADFSRETLEGQKGAAGSVAEGSSAPLPGGAALKSYMVSSSYMNNVTFVHATSDVIRYYCVHCSDRGDVGHTLEAGMSDIFSPKQLARGSKVESGAVPTCKLSHVELFTEQEFDYIRQFFAWIWYIICWIFNFICRWSPLVVAFCATVVIVNCFYVTLTMGNSQDSQDIVRTLYSFTLFCVLGEIIASIQGYRCGNKTAMWTHVVLTIYLFLCFGLVWELVYLVDGGDANDNDNSGGSNFYQWKCECNNNRRRLESNYDFQCPSTNYADICDTDCGVCGAPFYGTFVSFCVFFTFYFFVALFFGFFCLFHVTSKSSNLKVNSPTIHSHAVVTLHGSHAYGFPVRIRLALDEGLAVMKIFEKVHYEGGFADKELHRPITDPSRPAPGIQKVASDGADAIGQAFSFIVKLAMQLLRYAL